MLSFIKCFEGVLIRIISDLFPDTLDKNLQHHNLLFLLAKLNSETTFFVPFGKTLIGLVEMEQKNFFAKN